MVVAVLIGARAQVARGRSGQRNMVCGDFLHGSKLHGSEKEKRLQGIFDHGELVKPFKRNKNSRYHYSNNRNFCRSEADES
jgi:hypothetical protein